MQAIYEYNPEEGPNEDDGEISFDENECLVVFGDMDEDGFFYGMNQRGDKGMIPSNFVEEIDYLTARTDAPDLVELVRGEIL